MLTQYLTSPQGLYVAYTVLLVLGAVSTRLIHTEIRRIEAFVSQKAPADEAVRINDLLEAVDRLTETAVQDANSRIVIELKKHNLFTPETASSVKAAVIGDIMKNLGPLSTKASAVIGPLEMLIGQTVEKYVLAHKPLIDATITKTPA